MDAHPRTENLGKKEPDVVASFGSAAVAEVMSRAQEMIAPLQQVVEFEKRMNEAASQCNDRVAVSFQTRLQEMEAVEAEAEAACQAYLKTKTRAELSELAKDMSIDGDTSHAADNDTPNAASIDLIVANLKLKLFISAMSTAIEQGTIEPLDLPLQRVRAKYAKKAAEATIKEFEFVLAAEQQKAAEAALDRAMTQCTVQAMEKALRSARQVGVKDAKIKEGEFVLAAEKQKAAEAALDRAMKQGIDQVIEEALRSARQAGVKDAKINDCENTLAERRSARQSNMIFVAKISRLSPEQLQVCCTNMVGELETCSFQNDATLMDLGKQIVRSKSVARQCQKIQISMISTTREFLLDDGTQVQKMCHIADYERLTIKIGFHGVELETFIEELEIDVQDATTRKKDNFWTLASAEKALDALKDLVDTHTRARHFAKADRCHAAVPQIEAKLKDMQRAADQTGTAEASGNDNAAKMQNAYFWLLARELLKLLTNAVSC